MSLCRHYVRELRRSVLVETPDHEKGPGGSKRSSVMLDQMGDIDRDHNGVGGPSMYPGIEEKTPDQRVSAFLRKDRAVTPGGNNGYHNNRSPHGSFGSAAEKPTDGSPGERRPRPSLMMGGSTGTNSRNNSDSPAHTVARPDIRASAEKILYTYLLPGSEREIILPDSITARVTTAIEEQGRDDPEVFDDAKDYVFQAMERDAFPGFLRAKALSNLVPPSIMLRLIIGLLGMFGGFWTAFILIFLNYSRPNRLWVCLFDLYFPCPFMSHLPLHSDIPSSPLPSSLNSNLNEMNSSSSPSPSASTLSPPINTPSIPSWLFSDSANTHSCPLPASGSRTCARYSINAP